MYLSIFQTIEFYVVMVFIAAAVVGLAAMPSRRGAARQALIAGELISGAPVSDPAVTVTVNDDGSVTIYRHGLDNVPLSGAYSLAVTFIGFDVTVDERLVYTPRDAVMATAATATVTGFGAERYHFLYRSEATGRSAAFSLNIRPGNTITRALS